MLSTHILNATKRIYSIFLNVLIEPKPLSHLRSFGSIFIWVFNRLDLSLQLSFLWLSIRNELQEPTLCGSFIQFII